MSSEIAPRLPRAQSADNVTLQHRISSTPQQHHWSDVSIAYGRLGGANCVAPPPRLRSPKPQPPQELHKASSIATTTLSVGTPSSTELAATRHHVMALAEQTPMSQPSTKALHMGFKNNTSTVSDISLPCPLGCGVTISSPTRESVRTHLATCVWTTGSVARAVVWSSYAPEAAAQRPAVIKDFTIGYLIEVLHNLRRKWMTIETELQLPWSDSAPVPKGTTGTLDALSKNKADATRQWLLEQQLRSQAIQPTVATDRNLNALTPIEFFSVVTETDASEAVDFVSVKEAVQHAPVHHRHAVQPVYSLHQRPPLHHRHDAGVVRADDEDTRQPNVAETASSKASVVFDVDAAPLESSAHSTDSPRIPFEVVQQVETERKPFEGDVQEHVQHDGGSPLGNSEPEPPSPENSIVSFDVHSACTPIQGLAEEAEDARTAAAFAGVKVGRNGAEVIPPALEPVVSGLPEAVDATLRRVCNLHLVCDSPPPREQFDPIGKRLARSTAELEVINRELDALLALKFSTTRSNTDENDNPTMDDSTPTGSALDMDSEAKLLQLQHVVEERLKKIQESYRRAILTGHAAEAIRSVDDDPTTAVSAHHLWGTMDTLWYHWKQRMYRLIFE